METVLTQAPNVRHRNVALLKYFFEVTKLATRRFFNLTFVRSR